MPIVQAAMEGKAGRPASSFLSGRLHYRTTSPLTLCTGETIMAAGTVVNQGKSAFLEKFLGINGYANTETVNKAWNAAGNQGTISPGLLKKLRSKLGLTNKRTQNAGATTKAAAPMAKGKASKGAKTKRESKPQGVRSLPKDFEGDTGTGKSAFVREMLGRKPRANVKAVNEEWRSAGNRDKISDSIYYTVKRDLGASGKEISVPKKSKPGSATSGPATRPTVEARPESGGETIPSSPVNHSKPGDREQVLDRVEDGIDDLMIELKQLGGMEAALESLKKVRRVVVRSHEG